MPNYQVNETGVAKARELIASGKVDDETDWADAKPSAGQENGFIDANGYDAYGEWHLAVDGEASPETKGRYGFPFGDFQRLNRGGLTSAKQRAAQYEHAEIERAADELLARLDPTDD